MSATPLDAAAFAALDDAGEFTAWTTANPDMFAALLAEGQRVVGERWLASRSLGHFAWTAHAITIAGGSATASAGGPVSSRSIGELSITYAVAAASSDYGSTKWGRLFEDLERRLGSAPCVDEGILFS